MKALSSMYEKLLANNKAGIEPGLRVKEGRSIKKNFKKMKLQINIHLINHQQRKIHKIIVFKDITMQLFMKMELVVFLTL